MALKMAEGNLAIAAKGLGTHRDTLQQRIERDPQLKAMYGARTDKTAIDPPNLVTTIVRTPDGRPANVVEDSALGEELMRQDRELLRDGLGKAGIKKETLDRIRSLEGASRNAGAFLSVTLDFTHRLHIYSQAALLEEMDNIRVHLRNGKLDPMVRVMWQRAFNEIADLLGKGYDRTLTGMQAMLQMMKHGDDPTKPPPPAGAKPGWQKAAPIPVTPPPP